MATDNLILYTNRRCPWAHRAHIALAELSLPFQEVTIDLDTPRTAEYLAINPRGLVPSLSFNGEILIESAIVSDFLANQYPSHLLPARDDPSYAIKRARIDLFVDAWFSKFQAQLFKLFAAKTAEEQASVVEAAVGVLVKEVEPKLGNAKPFFDGSERLTQAEVLTGSFALRLISLSKADVYPKQLWESVKKEAPNTARWVEAVAAHPSVTGIYDEQAVIEGTKKRIAKLRGEA
ncbi:thioredoxin-like protein [Podospora aff. communis PSN243]|uniref:Thioredoxin-like protein n=1 Tax=Podospora aff. communis PSN243 TaxID=3040156 RepID=A0AAV9GBT3_9PEZI|nr:thioredoxin-like protein [Podospora aff. communis PSN243]